MERCGHPNALHHRRRVLAVLAVCAGLAGGGPAFAADAGPAFAWPHGARAAVSLAYDDALDSQLDHAIPTLDKYGLKGSFYLQMSNPSVALRMEHWRAAARRGHELGNHSLFHQCARSKPGRDWVAPHRNLDTTSVEQMRDQVLLANTMLAAIDGRQERTYTLPCGDTLAGGRDYLPAVRAAFVAVKVGGGTGVIDAMATLDPLAVPVAAPEGSSGAALIAIVRQAAQRGTMVNFTFHGIGGDYLTVSSQAHEELVRFLADNRQLVWTDTFLNIMQHVRREQARLPAAR
ncbi:polysaccharide deacetylase family protein [Massilia yuzhufengensis]|uniref:Peptidoglycan/xylan/chitin deacetylase, PgdA/CDA1 family n=1 Tax=Massilia yuzhufengensis TaxID=1164594 RepID=A0A1I1DML0_9BURK|nr:polysaccharide deacetylase family protein [Massilia yuzhufengensis]SFB76131.1 Peptidoglycan/xylan/chitin deacetylase, PgdA/CDA1 family [Massilia yuzhufengensis]